MTDELQSKVLREVVCLRSKLNGIDYVGGKKQSAKGAQKSVKKTLNHDLFRNCLFLKNEVFKTMTQLRSHCHQIVVNEIDKVAISSFDDKRFLLEKKSLIFGIWALQNFCTCWRSYRSKFRSVFCSTKFILQLAFLPQQVLKIFTLFWF